MATGSTRYRHRRSLAAYACWTSLALAPLARAADPAADGAVTSTGAPPAPAGAATLPAGRAPGLARLATGLSLREQFDLGVGRSFFRDPWVAAPATTTVRDGLGPLFEAQSCAACHPDGGAARARAARDEVPVGIVVRLARPGEETARRAAPDPLYGDQVQRHTSTPGGAGEGTIAAAWTTERIRHPDGEEVELRRPVWSFAAPAHGPIDPATVVAARRAPSVAGGGLLDAVPDADILALADPDDRDGDGISGRPSSVWDHARGGRGLGRFGWKAGQPSLRQQVAAAFRDDVGITSALYPEQPCTERQADCRAAASGADPITGVEIDDQILGRVADFVAGLGVPARRSDDARRAEIARGEAVFRDSGCVKCHVPKHTTGAARFAALSGQVIWPYTDLLLHDMGPGLADGQSEFTASAAEWRTPPLWGVGRVARDPDRIGLLHDGRARTLAEAILWHGGEAQAARDSFLRASRGDRAALLSFLESL